MMKRIASYKDSDFVTAAAVIAATRERCNYQGLAPACKMIPFVEIVNVIFNDPATIVMWSDGTKTVVKRSDNDTYDPEKGMAMAIAKKFLGNTESKGDYYNVFKKWLTSASEK